MHLPHDSSMQNSMKKRATSTMRRGLVHHDQAARAHDRADRDQRLVVDRQCRAALGRDAAARRAAGLHRLELAAAGDAAADLDDDLAQRRPHRHLDQPGVRDLARPARRPWSPCSSRCRCREPAAAVADDGRQCWRSVSTLLIRVGLAPQARLAADRAGADVAAPRSPSMRGDQRRLLAADEGAGADPDVDPEVERRCRRCRLPSSRARSACLMAVSSRRMASGYSPRT